MVELKEGQEYYSEGDFYIYIEDVPSMPEFAVVRESGDGGYVTVVRKSNLILKEESWQWKRKEEHKKELEEITAKAEANFDAMVEKVIAKACKALQARMKMNILFGKSMGSDGWGIAVANELEKLIKEDAKEVVEDRKDIFA